MEKKELLEQLETLKKELETAVSAKTKTEIEAQIKALESKIPDVKAIEDGVKEIKEWQVKKDEADKKNQEALNGLVAQGKNKTLNQPKKSFSDAFATAVQENEDQFMKFGHRKDDVIKLQLKDISMDTKTVGDMLISSNLTGDPVASYGSRQGLIPGDYINFRDLVPTTKSPTGLYVFYREGAGEGAVARQTEGSAKAQVDSDFTEVKVVNTYLAAFQRFSKQMMHNLPWIQNTLSRILLRKFYQKENAEFYATLSAASDAGSGTGGNIAEDILNLIAEQRDNNFASSFILTTNTNWVSLMTTTRPSTGTDYSIPGGVSFDQNGVVRVAGVPVICAPWVTAGDIQVIDRDYVERVEVEGVNVEISYEDATNFTTNKVTARIECMEELNLLRTDAHLNLGTAS
jgi:HK97 family phage major capsid protein